MSQDYNKQQIVGRELQYDLDDGEYVRGRKRGNFFIGYYLQNLFLTMNMLLDLFISPILGMARDKFIVTPQICLAINDIDYVLQFIDPFVKGMLDKKIRIFVY